MPQQLRQFRPRTDRSVSLVELAVTIVIITIMVLITPKVLSQLVQAAEKEMKHSVAHRIAESWLAASISTDYSSVSGFTDVTEVITFQNDDRTYTTTFYIDREVVVDATMDIAVKHVRIRVRWPDNVNPHGEVVKATIVSETN